MKYYTSDNNVYINPDLKILKAHCLDQGLKLYDSDKKEIELIKIKTKK